MAVYLGSNKVNMLGGDGIPSAYVIPSGTYSISSNGIYDIGSYKSVDIQGSPDWWSLFMTSMRSQVKRANNCSFQSLINFSLPSHFFAGANLQDGEWKFPLVTGIGENCFNGCFKAYNSATVEFSICSIISSYAFSGNIRLSGASFPSCTIIGNGAFSGTPLSYIYFPNCTAIQSSAFHKCSKLTSIDFPNCTSISGYAFYSCSGLISISFPSCSYIGTNAFYGCLSLTSVSFPICNYIETNAFGACSSLTSVSFPSCSYIGTYAFYGCYNLLSLYLLGSSIPSLVSTNAFSSTPISNYTTSTNGVYGSIYVPASLYNNYLTTTNWSVYSSRIVSV